MAQQNWVTVVNAYTFSSTERGPELKTFKTLKALSAGEDEVKKGAFVVPPTVWEVGQYMRITASGIIGQKATAQSWEICPAVIPAATANIAVGNLLIPEASNKLKTAATARAKFGFYGEWLARCKTIGEKGRFLTNGFLTITTSSEVGITVAFPTAGDATGGESAELKLSEECRIVMGCKVGEESAENLIQLTNFTVEILN